MVLTQPAHDGHHLRSVTTGILRDYYEPLTARKAIGLGLLPGVRRDFAHWCFMETLVLKRSWPWLP